jgi:formylglycine-generating enzyme required for sulfatase activity
MIRAGIMPEDGDARYELVFWESIKDSKQAADYEAYLEVFPNGRFAPLAKARAAYLRKAEQGAKQQRPSPDRGPRVEEVEATEYEVITSANMRKAPAGDAQQIAVLDRGSRVLVTGRVVDSKWYRVKAKRTTGFVFGDLLRKVKPKAVSPSAKVSPPASSRPAAREQDQLSKVTPPPPPVTLGKLAEFQDCVDCPKMVSLPVGSFVMGDEKGDKSERPPHRVSISRPFAIGKYEITVGQWSACVKGGGCSFRPEKAGRDENLPVRDISWADGKEYVTWLSRKTGADYRLPTEAEWEYAARGGTSTRYWWGDRFERDKANCKNCGGPWDRKSPSLVGSYVANPFGLYDMNGSVWEWVSDCWHKSYAGAPSDGASWESPNCRVRVLRGGSWRNDSSYMYSAVRFKYDAHVRYLLNGLRVAKTLK